jgi:hypothetical protein
MYQRAKRYIMLSRNTLEINRSMLNVKMSGIVTMTPDRNLDLYKAKFKAHYMMLIHGQRILESLLDANASQEVKSLGEAQVQEEDVVRVMDQQFAAMLPEKKAKFYKLFGITNNDATQFAVFKRVIECAFGLIVGRGSTSTKRKAYTLLTISNPNMVFVQDTFKPSFPSVNM